LLPSPEDGCLSLNEKLWYYYYLRYSVKGALLEYFLNKKINDDTHSLFDSGRMSSAPFIIFENNEEQREFENFATNPSNIHLLNNLNYIDSPYSIYLCRKDNPKFNKMCSMIKVRMIYDLWLTKKCN
jgi:hypothetical protein